jgi:response regulator RpfG family c-di-GMP phosphodiesterase
MRPQPLDWSDAVGGLLAQRGRKFDPGVVEVFAAREGELRAASEDLSLVA